MKIDVLHAFLQDVLLSGSGQIEKKKLLWMLGRQNDAGGAWVLLLNEWEELAGDRDELRGIVWGNLVTLVRGKPDKVTVWAGE